MEKLDKHYERTKKSNETNRLPININTESISDRLKNTISKQQKVEQATWVYSGDIYNETRAENVEYDDYMAFLRSCNSSLSGGLSTLLWPSTLGLRGGLSANTALRYAYALSLNRPSYTALSNGYSFFPDENFKNRFNIDDWIFDNELMLKTHGMVTHEIENKLQKMKLKNFWKRKRLEEEELLLVDSYFGNEDFF